MINMMATNNGNKNQGVNTLMLMSPPISTNSSNTVEL